MSHTYSTTSLHRHTDMHFTTADPASLKHDYGSCALRSIAHKLQSELQVVFSSIVLHSDCIVFPDTHIFCLHMSGICEFYSTGSESEKISGDVQHFISMSGFSFSTWLAFHHTACGAGTEATGNGSKEWHALKKRWRADTGLGEGWGLTADDLWWSV